MLTLAALALALPPQDATPADGDGDGLSDFHEVHKHRTDPEDPDSDGDGIPDGDWLERREFTYVVRSVVQVMEPVTPEHLTDDFQDARVLDASEDRVELEVVHYPFSTAHEALDGEPEQRSAPGEPDLSPWLAAGPTSDHDARLHERLVAALAEDGIDVEAHSDRRLVEEVSAWLLRRAEPTDAFTTFYAAFDERGEPYVPDELAAHVGDAGPEELARELSARTMFEERTRGSCTSTAVYLSGCLRALGIPTRTVLGIPLFDAGDPREWAMAREGIRRPDVRRAVLDGLAGLERSWSSHTFNEVWIDGRWWQLDYDRLGVGILRPERFGLLTRVATFRDWADARAWETVGRRQALELRDAFLGGANPYSMLTVRDAAGEHCTLDLSLEPLAGPWVESLAWTDDPDLPDDVRNGIDRRRRFGLLARVEGLPHSRALRARLAEGERRVRLVAAGRRALETYFDPNCWWFRNDHALVYLPIDGADRGALTAGVEYRPEFPNDGADACFALASDLAIAR